MRRVVALVCVRSEFESPRRLGAPVLVAQENEPRLWLLVKQEEKRVRRIGGGRRFSSGTSIAETFYHFELQTHDVHTAERVSKKRLLTRITVTAPE